MSEDLINSWELWVKKIAQAAIKVLGECKVYVFGSMVEGRVGEKCDIDVLIVSSNVPERIDERAAIKESIEDLAELPLYHPFEIHLATPKEAKWYWKHIGKAIRVI